MKTVHDIIVKPIITEDSMARTADKKYAFEVMSGATKPEIARGGRGAVQGRRIMRQHRQHEEEAEETRSIIRVTPLNGKRLSSL